MTRVVSFCTKDCRRVRSNGYQFSLSGNSFETPKWRPLDDLDPRKSGSSKFRGSGIEHALRLIRSKASAMVP
jgi:hypothetical protein